MLGYLGGVNHRGLAESQRTRSFSTVPLVLCHGKANPKSKLKALYLCSSPGEFHIITKNDLIFLCFLVISCWDV